MSVMLKPLADLARGRMRSKLPALREALEGRVDDTHRVLLRHLLDVIDFLQGKIDQMSVDIDEYLRPYEPQIALLMQIPGIGRIAAATSPCRDWHGYVPLPHVPNTWPLGLASLLAIGRAEESACGPRPTKAIGICGLCWLK